MAPSSTAASGRPRLFRRAENLWVRVGCLTGIGFVVMFGLACSGLTGLALLASGPGPFLLACLLATVTAVPYGMLLLWLDRNEKEPILLVGGAFLWGAAVSTAFAGIFNSITGELAFGVTRDAAVAEFMTASFAAPFSEELTKGLAVMFLFLLFRKEFDNVLDGVLYGAIIGLGFAWFENITYYMDAAQMGGAEGMLKNFWARGIVSASGGSHAAYTALTGCAFGLVRVIRKGALRWLLVPFFWGLAMFAHFSWNTFVGLFVPPDATDFWNYFVNLPLAVVVLQAPFLLLLLITVAFVWRHENKIIAQYLSNEPEDVVRPGQLEQLVPARKRTLAGLVRFFSRGPGQWWHHRRLAQEQIELAFVKWHHARDVETTWQVDQDADVLRLRSVVRARQARAR